MERIERDTLIRQLFWDYHYSPEEVEDVLSGKKDHAGHLTKELIVRRILETYPWFTVIRIIPPDQLAPLLTKEQIGKLRSKSLQKQYAFLSQTLQQNL
jgi:hypothetical protein